MKAKFINEIVRGKESGIAALGIGKTSIENNIKSWLKRYKIKNYVINDNFTIDVDGDVDLEYHDLYKIPEYIQFNIVTGNFNMASTKISSLRGCPMIVKGTFCCGDNNLVTLEGGPIEVGIAYRCNYNKLTSLKGCAEIVGGTFQCNHNKLTSLKYGPNVVDNGYFCSENELTSLNGLPKNIKNVHFEHNKLIGIDYLPDSLESLDIRFNPIVITHEIVDFMFEKGFSYFDGKFRHDWNTDILGKR